MGSQSLLCVTRTLVLVYSRLTASMLTGEICSDEGITLRSSSHRASEGKEHPPSNSHKVKKQAKVAIP